jgi:hypothetical protein
MAQERWDDDDILFEDLAEALRATAPSARTIAEHAEDALSWQTIDADLLRAILTFDSSLEPAAETRSDSPETRVLVFTSAPLSLELEVLHDEVVGQILPAGAGEIHIETSDGAEFNVSVGESGFFELPPMPGGAIRLRCDTATGRVVTDWVQL